MKKLVLVIMIALMGGTFDAIASTNQLIEQSDRGKKRKSKKMYSTKRGSKKRQKRVSNQHSWAKVSIGRTCNKKRRR
jgi:hypothetical protein